MTTSSASVLSALAARVEAGSGALPTINDTIALIQSAHAGQVDKGGQAYWTHPFRVMQRLGDHVSTDTKLAALLHDVIEDTEISAVDLVGLGYPPCVVKAVELLTRVPDSKLTYIDWIRSIATSGNEIAIRVKIADNEDNIDPERIAQLPREQRDIAYRYARSLAILRPALAAQQQDRQTEGGAHG